MPEFENVKEFSRLESYFGHPNESNVDLKNESFLGKVSIQEIGINHQMDKRFKQLVTKHQGSVQRLHSHISASKMFLPAEYLAKISPLIQLE